jgi:transcriptional regulatory protein LevR
MVSKFFRIKIQNFVHYNYRRIYMELYTRLQIMKDAGLISEETFEGLNQIIEMFNSKWNVELTEENGAMLITHLSVAIERIKKGEIIEGIDSEIYSEIKKHKDFDRAKQMLKNIEEVAAADMPESEETFIMMHLCTLLESNK